MEQRARAEALARRQRVAEQLARATAANPNDPALHLRHGEARRRLGQRQEAAVAFRAAARLLAHAERFGDARAALKLALGQLPKSEILQAELAALEQREQESQQDAMVVQPVAMDVEEPEAPPIVVGRALDGDDEAPALDRAPVTSDLMPENVFEAIYVERRTRRSLATVPVLDLGEPQ